MTRTTRPTANASSNSTSTTEALIVTVRSVKGVMTIDEGIDSADERQTAS